MKTPALSPVAITTYKLPAGAYWVTDPCYVYPDGQWGEFCRFLGDIPSMFQFGNKQFFVWGTAYGDGTYKLKGPIDGECAVDAGLLSIIPESLVKKWNRRNVVSLAGLATRIELAEDFEIFEVGGDVRFAGYTLSTRQDDEENDDES